MAGTLALSTRRLVSPMVAVVFAVAVLAAVALGFGIRTWTEHAAPAAPVVVAHVSSSPQEPCRMGRAC